MEKVGLGGEQDLILLNLPPTPVFPLFFLTMDTVVTCFFFYYYYLQCLPLKQWQGPQPKEILFPQSPTLSKLLRKTLPKSKEHTAQGLKWNFARSERLNSKWITSIKLTEHPSLYST